jgi:hypothetical protein
MTPIQKPAPLFPATRRAVAALALSLAAAPVNAGSPPVELKMFVTSTQGNGDFSTDGTWAETEGGGLTGLAAADRICQIRAESATVPLAVAGSPVFRAWVSVAATDAFCHVLGLAGTVANDCNGQEPFPSPGPWYRVDGVPFVDSLDAFGGSRALGSASRNENGNFVSSLAWTGSNGDGSATLSTCGDWDSSAGFGSVGSTTSELYWGELSGDGSLACASNARLYCFQAPAASTPRRAWPGPAALVFLRTGGGSANLGGIAAADTVCQSQAANAGLPDPPSFRAWLSDDATNAGDRLTIDGPWRRVDGVRVAASKAALLDGDLDSAISVLPNGSQLSAADRAWTGTLTTGVKAANNCFGWISFNVAHHGLVGSTDESGSFWTASNLDDNCNDPGRFYCFGNTVVVFWDRFESGDVSRWSGNVGFVP